MPAQHKNIRLAPDYYMGRRSYFVTFCCEGRRALFTDRDRANWLIDNLRRQSTAYRFAVHAYCVMPDHAHIFAAGLETTSNLLAFVRNFKHTTEYEYRKRFRRALWQKKFYDHILRERDSADAVAIYIWANPVRAGICADPREYPYSGSFTTDWKTKMAPVKPWRPVWKTKTNVAPV